MGKKHTHTKKAKVEISSKQESKIDLSAIIPAYKVEKSIADCLESILKQNVDKMEIIIIDDGSIDNTRTIIEKYAEKYKQIVPVFCFENKGVSAARNAGLDVAHGDYIHFCDGDDSVPDRAYEELLRIAKEENADLVTGNYSRMYPNENSVIKPFSHYTAPTGKERCFESGNSMLWNKIYRRSLFEKNHLRFDEELKIYEDCLFFSIQMSQFIYTQNLAHGLSKEQYDIRRLIVLKDLIGHGELFFLMISRKKIHSSGRKHIITISDGILIGAGK